MSILYTCLSNLKCHCIEHADSRNAPVTTQVNKYLVRNWSCLTSTEAILLSKCFNCFMSSPKIQQSAFQRNVCKGNIAHFSFGTLNFWKVIQPMHHAHIISTVYIPEWIQYFDKVSSLKTKMAQNWLNLMVFLLKSYFLTTFDHSTEYRHPPLPWICQYIRFHSPWIGREVERHRKRCGGNQLR